MPKNSFNKCGMTLITKDNNLIRSARYTMGVLDIIDKSIEKEMENSTPILNTYENRIINYLLSQARMNKQEFKKHEFTFVQFCKELNVSKGTKQYKFIMEAIISLGCKSFWWKNKEGKYFVKHWLSSATSVDFENKKIELQLDESVRDVVFNLESNYTSFLYGFVAAFNNKYAFKVYEYLRSYLNSGVADIYFKDIVKDIANNQYVTTSEIKRNILDPTIKEINKKSDIIVSYSEIKKGDTVERYRFSLHKKKLDDIKHLVSTWGVDKTELDNGTYDKYLSNPRWVETAFINKSGDICVGVRLKNKKDYEAEEIENQKKNIQNLTDKEKQEKFEELQEKAREEIDAVAGRYTGQARMYNPNFDAEKDEVLNYCPNDKLPIS